MNKHNAFKRRVAQAAAKAQARREALGQHIEEQFDEMFAREAAKRAPEEVDYGIPAIRGWDLTQEYYLRSLAFDFKWEGPVIEDDTNPTFYNPRGFWAVHPGRLHWLIRTYNPKVVGWVEFTGKVIEHEHGWRGEVCTIQSLFLPEYGRYEYDEDVVHLLEQRYHCDVITVSGANLAQEVLREHR